MHWMLMPLRRYAEFSGRSRRKEYWMFQLFNWLIAAFVGLMFLVTYYAGMSEDQMNMVLTPIVGLACLYSLAAAIPGLAVAVRRLHDSDRSGWNLLWALVPFIGGFIVLYFYVIRGTPGANRFGPDPLEAQGLAFA